MIRRLGAVSAAMSIFAWAGPAGAQAVDPDVRCLTVSKFFAATEKDPGRKQLAIASAFFFLGRIDARLSPAQLKAKLGNPSALIQQKDAGQLMTACAKRVQISQQALMTMGRALTGSQLKK